MTLDTMQMGRLFRLANGNTLVLEPDTPYWVMAPGSEPNTTGSARGEVPAPRRSKAARTVKGTRAAKASGAKAVRRTRRAAPAPAPAAEEKTPAKAAKPEREQALAMFRQGKSLQEVHAAFPHLKYSTVWNWKQAAG